MVFKKVCGWITPPWGLPGHSADRPRPQWSWSIEGVSTHSTRLHISSPCVRASRSACFSRGEGGLFLLKGRAGRGVGDMWRSLCMQGQLQRTLNCVYLHPGEPPCLFCFLFFSMFLIVTSSSSFQVRFCALLLILCLVLHLTVFICYFVWSVLFQVVFSS